MIVSAVRLRVRYAETDAMGVAHHASYLPWLEVARTELLREHGLPYAGLEERGALLPVLEADVRYRRPARYDDELEIRTELRDRPTVRIELHYEVRRGPDVLATARTLHAFTRRDGRPARPPPEFAAWVARAFG